MTFKYISASVDASHPLSKRKDENVLALQDEKMTNEDKNVVSPEGAIQTSCESRSDDTEDSKQNFIEEVYGPEKVYKGI